MKSGENLWILQTLTKSAQKIASFFLELIN